MHEVLAQELWAQASHAKLYMQALHEDELCTRSLAQELRAQALHAELWVQALHKVLAQEPLVQALHEDLLCTRTLNKSLVFGPCTR